MRSIPASESDFSIEWMNEALGPRLAGCKVTNVNAQMSEAPGQTAEIVHIQVEYDRDDCPLPHHMVAKITSRNPAIIELIGLFGQYEREVKFYQQFPDVGIPVPDCYYCDHDAENQQMIILMKDLAPSMSPSWAINADQVRLAVHHLAPFHARWWNNETLLGKEWLVQREDSAFYHAAAGSAAAAADNVRSLFGDSVDYTLETVTKAHEKVDKIMEFMQSRPFTLVHGDYHGKQMFFPTGEGGEFAVIDWQFPFVAQGAWDLIRIVALGLSTSERHALQDELIEGYFHQLRSHGVTDYSRQDLDTDIRLGAWINQNIMVIAVSDTDVGILEQECASLGVDWRDLLLLRGDRLVEELRVLDFLEQF